VVYLLEGGLAGQLGAADVAAERQGARDGLRGPRGHRLRRRGVVKEAVNLEALHVLIGVAAVATLQGVTRLLWGEGEERR
jgi:hypothetical protein